MTDAPITLRKLADFLKDIIEDALSTRLEEMIAAGYEIRRVEPVAPDDPAPVPRQSDAIDRMIRDETVAAMAVLVDLPRKRRVADVYLLNPDGKSIPIDRTATTVEFADGRLTCEGVPVTTIRENGYAAAILLVIYGDGGYRDPICRVVTRIDRPTEVIAGNTFSLGRF
jgi:hypothetical protein